MSNRAESLQGMNTLLQQQEEQIDLLQSIAVNTDNAGQIALLEKIAAQLEGVNAHTQQIVGSSASTASASSRTANNTRGIILNWGLASVLAMLAVAGIKWAETNATSPIIQKNILQLHAAMEYGVRYFTGGVYSHRISPTDIPGESIAALHPDLQRVISLAFLKARDQGDEFFVKDAERSLAEQKYYFNKKDGTTRTLNSRHLPDKYGMVYAVDLTIKYAGNQNNKKDWEKAHIINKYMQAAAKDLTLTVEWGGNWKTFKDGFHWQLSWDQYPKNTAIKEDHYYPTLSLKVKNALIASIIHTESRNNQKIISVNGYLGWYQAGAAALVDAGFIRADRFKLLDDTAKSGKGKHKQFILNAENWTINGGHQAFLNSKAMQHRFRDDFIRRQIKRLVDNNAIKTNINQINLAGAIKAAWFGHKRAIAYLRDGIDGEDGNKTKVSKYYKDGQRVAKQALAI